MDFTQLWHKMETEFVQKSRNLYWIVALSLRLQYGPILQKAWRAKKPPLQSQLNPVELPNQSNEGL